MKILLAINNAYYDHRSGAAITMMQMMEWLAGSGHDVRVLSTGRYDGAETRNFVAELEAVGVEITPSQPAPLPAAAGNLLGPRQEPEVSEYSLRGVGVRVVSISRQRVLEQSAIELMTMVAELDALIASFDPDLVVSYGGGRGVQSFLRRAKHHGVTTLFTLHNYGYSKPDFAFADHLWTCSPWLTGHYRERSGVESTPMVCPIVWDQVRAGSRSAQRSLTFVNPIATKGVAVFARIAAMLRRERPDIPILVVRSAGRAEVLDEVLPFAPAEHPNLEVMDSVPVPAEFYARTKVLLVPSCFEEPFGRVAAEALINAIPPVVSSRGALPSVVGGAGIVLELPKTLGAHGKKLPSEAVARPWVDAITRLFDDDEYYRVQSEKAYAYACEHYGEAKLRRSYDEYFRGLVSSP